MSPEEKEILSRQEEIESELRALFKANMKISDWDIPEADDDKLAQLLVDVMQKALDKIKQEVKEGKYHNY